MKINLSWVFILLLVAVSNFSFAGSASGKITFLLVNYDTTPTYVTFNTEITASHACATPSGFGKWAVALDSDKGKSLLSLLLSAQASGTPINVAGGGTCYFQNRENVNFVYVGTQ